MKNKFTNKPEQLKKKPTNYPYHTNWRLILTRPDSSINPAQNPTPAAPTPSVAGRCGSIFLFFQKQVSGASLADCFLGSDLQRVSANGS